MTARDEIVEWTKALRRSDEPYWHDLRVELSARGLNADDIVVADRTPDEGDTDTFWLVTREGRFFDVWYEGPYVGEGAGPHSITHFGVLAEAFAFT